MSHEVDSLNQFLESAASILSQALRFGVDAALAAADTIIEMYRSLRSSGLVIGCFEEALKAGDRGSRFELVVRCMGEVAGNVMLPILAAKLIEVARCAWSATRAPSVAALTSGAMVVVASGSNPASRAALKRIIEECSSVPVAVVQPSRLKRYSPILAASWPPDLCIHVDVGDATCIYAPH